MSGGNLTSVDRSRLVAILGMLGSDHDGERASAALHADRMLRERGLQWKDVILSQSSSPAPEWTPPESAPGWRADVANYLRHLNQLTDWERGFLVSIQGRRCLSLKQNEVLRNIGEKLTG